jgi:hypothetical protein
VAEPLCLYWHLIIALPLKQGYFGNFLNAQARFWKSPNTTLDIRPIFRHTVSMPKRSSKKQPRDMNQLAKAVVDLATDEATTEPITETERPIKNAAAVELGRLGGRKGGAARAQSLSAKRRQEIARIAAQARWRKKSE